MEFWCCIFLSQKKTGWKVYKVCVSLCSYKEVSDIYTGYNNVPIYLSIFQKIKKRCPNQMMLLSPVHISYVCHHYRKSASTNDKRHNSYKICVSVVIRWCALSDIVIYFRYHTKYTRDTSLALFPGIFGTFVIL